MSSKKPLVLNELLIPNVNTWGNVQYNIPLRLSSNETRTGTSIALRHIPEVSPKMDFKEAVPIPECWTEREMALEKETYRTTSGEYTVKPNPNYAMEKADRAINCKRVSYMTGVEKRLSGKYITQPMMLSEMKDNFRGMVKTGATPPEVTVNAPDPDNIFDVVASGRNEVPALPASGGGFRKQLDPYLTTYRERHRPFTTSEHYGIACKNQITYYSQNERIPKVRGFGPRHKEIWMPLTAKPHKGVFDKIHVKKEYHEVAACRNPVNNLKGVFESETKKKYKIPHVQSSLASWGLNETFPELSQYAPSPLQALMAPNMYCSDYCLIAQGSQPCSAIDQVRHGLPPHKGCGSAIIVSKEL